MTDIGHFFFFHSVNPGSSIDRSRKVGDEGLARSGSGALSSYFRVLSSLSLSPPFSTLILRIGELTRTMPAASFAG